MSSVTVDFSQAKVRPKIRTTHQSDGLVVAQELKGAHLHQIFGIDNMANIDVGYSQIFSATDRYHGKPMLGMTSAKGKIKKITSHGLN